MSTCDELDHNGNCCTKKSFKERFVQKLLHWSNTYIFYFKHIPQIVYRSCKYHKCLFNITWFLNRGIYISFTRPDDMHITAFFFSTEAAYYSDGEGPLKFVQSQNRMGKAEITKAKRDLIYAVLIEPETGIFDGFTVNRLSHLKFVEKYFAELL